MLKEWVTLLSGLCTYTFRDVLKAALGGRWVAVLSLCGLEEVYKNICIYLGPCVYSYIRLCVVST